MSSPIEKGRMMVRALTLEDLNKAAKLGGPSTLSEKTLLEPAAGPEGIIAPAKYTGSNGATYVFEDRYIDGESKRTVNLKSAIARLKLSKKKERVPRLDWARFLHPRRTMPMMASR